MAAVGFSWDLPGPLVPIPPPRRDISLPCPTIRGAVYLRQSDFHLKLAPVGGMEGENVKDKHRPVDNPDIKGVLKVLYLGRGKLIVNHRKVYCTVVFDKIGNFGGLSFTDIGGGVGVFP